MENKLFVWDVVDNTDGSDMDKKICFAASTYAKISGEQGTGVNVTKFNAFNDGCEWILSLPVYLTHLLHVHPPTDRAEELSREGGRFKKGDEIVLKDISLDEPSIYDCDKGVFIEYSADGKMGTWESRLGGTYTTTIERILPIVGIDVIETIAWKCWDKVNSELHHKGGVNPSAYILGFKDAAIQVSQLLNALDGLLNKDEGCGCPMCDSGKLRNSEKVHWDDCVWNNARKVYESCSEGFKKAIIDKDDVMGKAL